MNPGVTDSGVCWITSLQVLLSDLVDRINGFVVTFADNSKIDGGQVELRK